MLHGYEQLIMNEKDHYQKKNINNWINERYIR